MIVLTYMVAYKVLDTYTADIRTFDMRTPTWPFFLAAWIGLGAAILLEWMVGCGETYTDAKGVQHDNQCLFINVK